MQTTHFHASFAHVYTTVKSAMHIINKVELISVVVVLITLCTYAQQGLCVWSYQFVYINIICVAV